MGTLEQLSLRDFKEIVHYIYDHLEDCLFMLQSIEWTPERGFSGIKPGAVFYGYWREGKLKGLMLFTSANCLIPHYEDERVLKKLDFLRMIREHRPEMIKGRQHITEGIWPMLLRIVSDVERYPCDLMKLRPECYKPRHQLGVQLICKRPDELHFNSAVDFLIQVEKAFNRNPLSINKLKDKLSKKSEDNNYYFLCNGEEPVAQGIIEFSGKQATVIGGIYTSPKWRGKGIGGHITEILVDELLKRNQEPYLLVLSDNGPAKSVYGSLGFEYISPYEIIELSIA